jgi:endonuclease/exonuclease/phosphatase family metal-dependent hydrolase
MRGAERVGIEVGNTIIINIYHHRNKILDIRGIMDEIQRSEQKRWVCAGDFNCHQSIWDGHGWESAASWREVEELIEIGRLMIEPGTPTWKGGKNHRTSTIDLVIASHEADISMAEIATDLYTGSDHETLYWEIIQGYNISDQGKIRKVKTTLENVPANQHR